MAIGYLEVSQAAESLIAAGERPTIRNIRAKLGTGSLSTIQRHFSVWRDAKPVKSVSANELSPGLLNAIATEIERSAAAAKADVESELVAARQEADDLATDGQLREEEQQSLLADLAAVRGDREQLLARVSMMESELAKARISIEAEKAAAEVARVTAAKAELKLEGLAERTVLQHDEIVGLRVELSQAQGQLIELSRDLAVSRAEVKAERAIVERLEASIQRLDVERAAADERYGAERLDIQRRADESEKANAVVIENLRVELQEVRKQLVDRSAELAAANVTRASAEARLKTIEEVQARDIKSKEAEKRSG